MPEHRLEDKNMVSITRTKRYFITCFLTFIAVTATDSTNVMESTESTETFSSSDSIKCAIILEDEMYSKTGLNTGFNYELLRQFAKTCRRKAEVVTAKKGENYLDSLMAGTVDIVVVRPDNRQGEANYMVSMKTGENSVWAVRKGEINKIKIVNSWIRHFEMTDEYKVTKDRFFSSYSPTKADAGIHSHTLSPYDSIIKKYAKKIGWDWRMLAAVVYQESKFSISSHSGRGAAGLMQVLPSTAEYYNIRNLTDPEENIKAGTLHLARLQYMFKGDNMEQCEKIKFTLAAYNAGEGRVADCRSLAKSRGFDNNIWEDVLKVIPEMRTDDILDVECVKLGKFKGHETTRYVENVMEIYNAFCTICPKA